MVIVRNAYIYPFAMLCTAAFKAPTAIAIISVPFLLFDLKPDLGYKFRKTYEGLKHG